MSHAGTVLVAGVADRTGLTAGLSAALAGTRERRSVHAPGRVPRDVSVMLTDGGDWVADLEGLRGQERLFGPVASETTTHRTLKALDETGAGRGAWRANCGARGHGRRVPRPDTLTLYIDVTLLTAHSERDRAAGNYKHGFGFHPIGCWLAETGEPLAAVLRSGNAGSNTAKDHFQVLSLAVAQLPAEDLDREMLSRTDVGGCTHAFAADCRDAGTRFSIGHPVDEPIREQMLNLPRSLVDPGG